MHLKGLFFSIVLVFLLLFLSIMPMDLKSEELPIDETWSDEKQQLKNLTEEDPIIIAIGEWEPYVGENIEDYGFISEIVAAVMDEAKIPYTLKFYPWKRSESLILEGVAWASFPYARTEERKGLYLYSEALFQSFTKFFYYRPQFDGSKVYYSKLEDLSRYKVGGVYANYYKSSFETAKLNVDWSSNEKNTIHKLVSGRIDLMPYEELQGWTFINEMYAGEIQNFGFIDKAIDISNGDLMLIVDKDNAYSADLLARFNKGLRTIHRNGEYDKILKKHNLD